MDESIKNDQVQACPQCGSRRKYFGVEDGGHEHGHKDEKHRRYGGRGE